MRQLMSIQKNSLIIDHFIKENEIDEIEHVDVRYAFVLFEDSRVWSLSHEMRQDSENLRLWKVIGIWH